MHWAERVAREIIEKYPDREVYTCASGISPSGSVHIGNFREIITTYFVVRALQKLGKQTRFIFSWDDYDRFRKVPKNIDPSYEQYIGLPYADIPDPYGCHGSYAEHFECEFEEALSVFGIDVEFIYQNKEYRNGRYNNEILHTLKSRREIYDILMSFKTQESAEEERNNFYPVAVYCESCGRDNTTIHAFDDAREIVSYSCTCGHSSDLKVLEARCMKLNWKSDWAMRWMIEDVIFEPGGRDHSSETGSFNVSKEIVQHIYNHHAPEYVAYEFIGIKGGGSKMSSSSGNVLTPGDLLQVYLPEVLLFIFSKYLPGAAFNIGLDNDVNRNYTEYERYSAQLEEGVLANEGVAYALSLAQVHEHSEPLPKFSQVAGVFPLINYDHEILTSLLNRMGEGFSQSQVEQVSRRAEHWIREWQPERNITVNASANTAYFETLVADDRAWLESFCDVIREKTNYREEELMRRIYAICYDEDPKVKRSNQKRLFKHVYNLVLGQNNGPRIPLLIEAVGESKLLSLLNI